LSWPSCSMASLADGVTSVAVTTWPPWFISGACIMPAILATWVSATNAATPACGCHAPPGARTPYDSGRRDARITQTIRHIIKSSRPARPRPRRRSCRCIPRRGTRGPRRSRLPVGLLSTCSRTDAASVRDERCGTRPRRPVVRPALRPRAIVDLPREYALPPG